MDSMEIKRRIVAGRLIKSYCSRLII